LSGGQWSNVETAQQELPYDVACPPAGSCTAVGFQRQQPDPNTVIDQGVVETFSGGSWASVAAPVPANVYAPDPDNYLTSVACVPSTTCTVVGQCTAGGNPAQGYWKPVGVEPCRVGRCGPR